MVGSGLVRPLGSRSALRWPIWLSDARVAHLLCSQDCPPDAEDFRAQQCSAYNDVQYQGRYYEWLPRYNDPVAPCALKCHARGQSLVVELAPKVLDGTRCSSDSLDMCISGICQVSHTCFPYPGVPQRHAHSPYRAWLSSFLHADETLLLILFM